MAGRIACLLAPLFPLAARLRVEPELRGEPVAVVDGEGTAAVLVAASRAARRAGVRAGQTPAQARALLPGLLLRRRDAAAEAAARQALLEAADALSPRVEDAAPGLAYLDVDGLERQFPGADGEADLARALIHRAGRLGLPAARAGVAGGKRAARLAALASPTPTVIPAGEAAARLAPLPLARLEPPPEIAETLAAWGLRTVGDLARLPRGAVVDRLGEAGRRLHAAARGADPEPLVPRRPPPRLEEGFELEWAVAQVEPLLFLARPALERLCRRLEGRGLGCARLGLSLRLDPDGAHERALHLPAPSRDVKTLLSLVRLDLEAHPPGAPVVGFALAAHPGRLRAAQMSLFGPRDVPPDRLATALGRLAALLGGDDRVGSPRTVDGHRPERRGLAPYAPPPPPREAPAVTAARRRPGAVAVRVLRPPVPVEVLLGAPGAPGHPPAPAEVCPPPGEGAARRPRLAGRVRVASGPWRLEEGWWRDDAADRDYWDVELEGGRLVRLFHDRTTGAWHADGIYD